MTFKPVILGSDLLLFISLVVMSWGIRQGLKKTLVRQAFRRLFQHKTAVLTTSILVLYVGIALLDSLHFQKKLPSLTLTQQSQYSSQIESVLDVMFGRRATAEEKTYSVPFALVSYLKVTQADGQQTYPRLNGIPSTIGDTYSKTYDIFYQLMYALLIATGVAILFVCLGRCCGYRAWTLPNFYLGMLTLAVFAISALVLLSQHYHVLGTGKIGEDIFYQTIKSIRTGLVIGLLTTLVTLPFAIGLGLSAGYFGGKVDDVIQYIYITISSIPGVLLIAASVLSMQVFISNHPEWFTTLMARSDARLVALCIILGMTGWTSLCRVLRAETLKLREIEYVQAAKALGTSAFGILLKHILPNVMHLILIAVVLDFSFLVLAEAVLSYIGVGVSPLTISWGNMINGARLELAREPIVWWPMFAAFLLMFIFVLSVNLLADKVRDAFDPRQ